jgi:hypothetical protein
MDHGDELSGTKWAPVNESKVSETNSNNQGTEITIYALGFINQFITGGAHIVGG